MLGLTVGRKLRQENDALRDQVADLRRRLGITGAALAEMEAEVFDLRRKVQPRDPRTGRMLPKPKGMLG